MKIALTLLMSLALIGCSTIDCREEGRTLEATGPRIEESVVTDAKEVVKDIGEAIGDAFDASLRFNLNRDVFGCDIPGQEPGTSK